VNSNFFRKRWLDFRNGHSIYLAFILTFVNFILITYNFAVEKVPMLNSIFGHNLIVFTIFFIAVYIPSSMLIGYWHRRNQYRVENETLLAENWIWAWLTRYQIRLIEGKTTPEENKEVLIYLENILKRHKMDRLIGSTGTGSGLPNLARDQSGGLNVGMSSHDSKPVTQGER
jgi:hypothetical protein